MPLLTAGSHGRARFEITPTVVYPISAGLCTFVAVDGEDISVEATKGHGDQRSSGISRRDLLRRGAALGGAVLWVTPAMQTVGMSRALAQETSPIPSDGEGTVEGTVVDATDPSVLIAGALVEVVGTGISTTTDVSGNFQLLNVPAGPQTLEVSATGYVTSTTSVEVVDGDTVNKVVALSPVTTEQITAVLTWGSVPNDLDLHASGPDGSGGRFHAYFAAQSPVPHVALDVDDTSSFGPETMAFKIVGSPGSFVAGTYRVWVHDFTNGFGSSTPQWDVSDASVVFTGLSGQIAEYLVDTAVADEEGAVDANDKLWRVFQFDLDADGNVSNIVVFQNFMDGTATTSDIV